MLSLCWPILGKKIKATPSLLVNNALVSSEQQPIIVKDEESIIQCAQAIQENNFPFAAFLMKRLGITLQDLENNSDFDLPTLFTQDNENLIKFLISQGFNPNYKVTSKTTSPLHVACRFNRTEIIKALIKGGANISAQDEREKIPFERLNQRNTQSAKNLLIWIIAHFTLQPKEK